MILYLGRARQISHGHTQSKLRHLFTFQRREICEFPSRHFYKGRLKTYAYPENSVDYQNPKLQAMWPNQTRPLVFCHVEGAEKSLVITSSDGHEASKSNNAERDHAVSRRRAISNSDAVIQHI